MDIASVRSNADRTITSVARTSKLSPITVRAVERGDGSISSMLKVLKALNAEVSWQGKHCEQLGAALAKHRTDKGISQRQMAAQLGVTQPTIIALEVRNSGRMSTLHGYLRVLGINSTVLVKTYKTKLVPAKNSSEADRVYTPSALALAIIDHLPLSGTVLDPCRGDGAFFDKFPVNVDRKWCEIDQGRDFLDWNERVSWCVSNPPWSKMREFLVHGMRVADNVCYLAALTHFTTKARVRDMTDHGFAMRSVLFVPTPKAWPQSGFQMAAVWLQRSWDGPCEMKHLK